MNGKNCLHFLSELTNNNNRDWFAQNKNAYQQALTDFEEIVNYLIVHTAAFDQEISGLQAKDCIFRIYRDVRFSHDKSPYKNHLGAYISVGGRKSLRAGYYIHFEPGGCLLSGGIYCPQPDILKALRKAVYDNIDEYKAIVEKPSFKSIFCEVEEKLKTIPRGFPSDFPEGDYLKNKHYAFTHRVNDIFFESDDCMNKTIALFKQLHPINQFLNYTVDEVLND